MHAASRVSYAAATERLDTLATDATGAQLRTVADELFAVAQLLVTQPRLRRALADPARPGTDRAALLRELLGDQVGDDTRTLLDALVGGRWSAPSELLGGCEELGVQALLASAERDGTLAQVEDELFRFAQVMADNPALAAVLGDRAVAMQRRVALVDDLLAGRADVVTVRAVTVALGGFGGRSVPAALIRLVEHAAQRRNRSVAYVTVATPLTGDGQRRLGAALAARYGRDISLKTTVDPRVIGGVRVQVGADLYDGTVSHRLARARTALASG
jgi:F-type H+-transporting ATPase subunit delta